MNPQYAKRHDAWRGYLLCVALFGLNPSTALSDVGGDREFSQVEVAAGVYAHLGRHASLDDAWRGDSANLAFVVGTRCVAVIDTGGSVATGRSFRLAIRAVTPLPVCYVINTHAHFDHVLGNAAFVADDPEFIGHANLAEALSASADYFKERFALEVADVAEPVILPTLKVDGEHTLDLGERRLRLVAHPEAHTTADLTVVDEATHTYFTGDLLFRERLPVLDGKLRGWQRWMEEAARQPYAHIVPGHGPISADWPKVLLPQQKYLAELVDTVTAALAAGEFLEDVLARAGEADLAGWQITDMHARNLSKAFRELEWE